MSRMFLVVDIRLFAFYRNAMFMILKNTNRKFKRAIIDTNLAMLGLLFLSASTSLYANSKSTSEERRQPDSELWDNFKTGGNINAQLLVYGSVAVEDFLESSRKHNVIEYVMNAKVIEDHCRVVIFLPNVKGGDELDEAVLYKIELNSLKIISKEEFNKLGKSRIKGHPNLSQTN